MLKTGHIILAHTQKNNRKTQNHKTKKNTNPKKTKNTKNKKNPKPNFFIY